MEETLLGAVTTHDMVLFHRLLDGGTDPNETDDDGWTALMYACIHGNMEAVRALEAAPHIMMDAVDKDGYTALMISIGFEQPRIAAHLLENPQVHIHMRNREGNTVLHEAAKIGDIESVRKLLTKGAQVNAHNNYNSTPLIEAAANGHLAVVEYLIDNGGNPTLKDRHGLRAYDWAHRRGHPRVAALLTDEADPEQRASSASNNAADPEEGNGNSRRRRSLRRRSQSHRPRLHAHRHTNRFVGSNNDPAEPDNLNYLAPSSRNRRRTRRRAGVPDPQEV